jgi:hypothetical protein
MSDMTGLDIHGGLRIRLEYNAETRTIDAKWSAETSDNHAGEVAAGEVEHYIATLARKIGYAEAWLHAYASGGGEGGGE